jgi:hypothetical protein
MRGSRWLLASFLVLLVSSVAGIDAPHATAHDDPDTAPTWLVTKTGLTENEAGSLADAFGPCGAGSTRSGPGTSSWRWHRHGMKHFVTRRRRLA